jgi:UPF0271 protein
MAESYGNLKTGNDFEILPFIDAANIACGFHGGDPLTIRTVLAKAIELGKEIGAHPSYPDLVGFGRRYIQMSKDELNAAILYQVGAVKSVTESLGGRLSHVKPHGALYNIGAKESHVAEVIVQAIKQIDANLTIYAPANSALHHFALACGMDVKCESFADRRYNLDGSLVSRDIKGSVIEEPDQILRQVIELLDGRVETITGEWIAISSQTICLHGDHPSVVDSLRMIRANL